MLTTSGITGGCSNEQKDIEAVMVATPDHMHAPITLAALRAGKHVYFVGDKGTMVGGSWSGAPQLFPQKRRQEFPLPPKTIPRSPGHRQEWIQACKAKRPQDAKAGFEYSGPFTEVLLVGNLATRVQKRIEWDAGSMRALNAPEADPLIRKHYREGFGIA